MGQPRNYALSEVVVSIGGRRVTGFADGDAISCTLDDDDWVATPASNGDVVRSRKINRLATVTLKLTQGVEANEWIMARANQDAVKGNGAFDLHIQDAHARLSLVKGRAWVKKRADINFATEAGQIDHVLAVAVDTWSLGTQDRA